MLSMNAASFISKAYLLPLLFFNFKTTDESRQTLRHDTETYDHHEKGETPPWMARRMKADEPHATDPRSLPDGTGHSGWPPYTYKADFEDVTSTR